MIMPLWLINSPLRIRVLVYCECFFSICAPKRYRRRRAMLPLPVFGC